MKNKTPIQELILWFEQNGTRFITEFKDEYQEKEKQFAFDCFEAGFNCGSIVSITNEMDSDFDEFYSQYSEQHTN